MTAELFIHGPRHAFYGPQSEAVYSQLFDNSQIKDDVRFVVEIRRGANGNNYAYYNYCRYNNVQDIDGRGGAYIGISIRLDAYYTNLKAMFVVLESAFNRGSIGLLVNKVPDGYRYCVASFDQVKQQILEKIEKSIGALLSNLYNPSEYLSLDSSFHTGKEILKAIDDIGAANARLKDLRAYGKIIFASTTPTEAVKDAEFIYSQKVKELNRQHEQNTNELSSSLLQIKTENDDLKSEVQSLLEEQTTMVNRLKGIQDQNIRLNSSLKKENLRILNQEKINRQLSTELEIYKKEISELKRKVDYLQRHSQSQVIETLHQNLVYEHNSQYSESSKPDYQDNQKSEISRISELWEGFKKYRSPFFFLIAFAIFVYVTIALFGHKKNNSGIDTQFKIDRVDTPSAIRETTLKFLNDTSIQLFTNAKR